MKLTASQRKWMARANDLGQIRFNGPRGLAHGVWERMMKRLVAEGLVTPNPFGEYEITAAGRTAMARHEQKDAAR